MVSKVRVAYPFAVEELPDWFASIGPPKFSSSAVDGIARARSPAVIAMVFPSVFIVLMFMFLVGLN